MLGSLVRVSRRVAWMTDLLPLDELASTQSGAYRQLTSTRFLSRSKERDIHPQTCLAQDPGPPAKQHPTSGGTRNPDQQGATEPSNMGITLDKRPESQLSSYLPIPRFTAVSTKLILISQRIRTRGWEMHRQAAIQHASPGTALAAHHRLTTSPQTRLNPSLGKTSWVHAFTHKRFHVLLNSLFKVLCNFPSRYLYAIS